MDCCMSSPKEAKLPAITKAAPNIGSVPLVEEPQAEETPRSDPTFKLLHRRSSGFGNAIARESSLSSISGGSLLDSSLMEACNEPTALGPFANYIGVSAVKNARPYMEDFYDVVFNAQRKCSGTAGIAAAESGMPIHYCGVFDGHGGQRTARHLSKELIDDVVKQPAFAEGNLGMAVEEGFAVTDAELRRLAKARGGSDDGSCCCTVWLRGEHVMVANVGDSRAVMSSGGTAVALSNDHKPNRPDEKRRIQSYGGFVQVLGVPRVNGVLAVSRAFGDSSLKPFITSAPEIAEVELGAIGEDEFIIVASDGLWDVLGNQDAVDLAHKHFKKEKSWEAAARALTDIAIRKGSGDNITVVIVSLDVRNVAGV